MNLQAMRTLFEAGILLGGMILLAGAGATAHALSDNAWITAATMLATAGAIATKGRQWAQACWELMLIGEADPYGAPTHDYKRTGTTRSRRLAPKLERLIRRATQQVQIVVVGTEPDYMAGDGKRWETALESAALAGAQISMFMMPYDDAGKLRAEALATRYANVECFVPPEVPDT